MDGKNLARQIGAAIRARRKAKGWTQAQLAEAVSVEKETISRFETGVISPTLERLVHLAEILGCSVGELFRTPSDKIDAEAATIAALIHSLPEERRELVVQLVENVARVLAAESKAKS